MKRTRWILGLLILCLMAASAGCGPEATPGPTTTRVPANLGVLNPPGTLPVVNQPDKLRIFVSRQSLVTSYEYGKNALTTWLQDRTGVELEILVPDGDPAEEFRMRLFSGGDLGDLVLLRQDLRRTGRIWRCRPDPPAGRYVEKYGHHVLDLIDTFRDTLPAVTAPDGHIYAFPQGNLEGLNPSAFGMRLWIHRDFLASYGRGMPGSTAEFASYLRWVRDADADGDGRTDDEIPWTGSDSREIGYARPTDFLMNAFTLQDGNGYYVLDGKIHCAMVENGWREGLRYLRGCSPKI
jgi:putative aldouronate transport system substrate-binding protein